MVCSAGEVVIRGVMVGFMKVSIRIKGGKRLPRVLVSETALAYDGGSVGICTKGNGVMIKWKVLGSS